MEINSTLPLTKTRSIKLSNLGTWRLFPFQVYYYPRLFVAVKVCLLILPDPLGNNVALLLHNGWTQHIIVLGVEGGGGGWGQRLFVGTRLKWLLRVSWFGACLYYLFASARFLAQTTFFIVYEPVVSKLPNFACPLNSRKIINNRRIICTGQR